MKLIHQESVSIIKLISRRTTNVRRFLIRLIYISFTIIILLSIFSERSKADLNYETFLGTGARPTFPGNGGTLNYPTVLSSGTVSSLDYNWGSGVILDSGKSDKVIVHFYGNITIPDTGSQNIRFYLYADDGVYMSIGNTVVINDWNEQGPSNWNYISTEQTLVGGQTYYIDAWWYENGGGAAFRLYWDQSGSVALVPSSTYSTTAPTPTSAVTSTQLQTRTTNRNIIQSENGVYIEQSEDNLTLNVEQHGEGHLIAGTSTTNSQLVYAGITGDFNTVSVTQGHLSGISDNNVLLFDMLGNHNTLTVEQGNNTTDLGGHRATIDINGSYNDVGLYQYGGGQTGAHFADIGIMGNDNTVTAHQRDNGDKISFANITGNNSTLTVNQNDTGEHFLDVALGSNQTLSVTQQGSGNHSATVYMEGYSSGLTLNQNSSTDQNYYLYQNCINTNGCGTTTFTQN
jgi:hypothetical protein